MPRRLPIDLEDVQLAFEDRDGEGRWFLDTTTGEVIRLSDDDDDDLAEQVASSGDRYIAIPFQGSQSGYRDMAEFIRSVADHRLRAQLDTAIRGSGAFRRFKDVLRDAPEERERWFAFEKDCIHHRIRRWLESEDIEPVTPPRAR